MKILYYYFYLSDGYKTLFEINFCLLIVGVTTLTWQAFFHDKRIALFGLLAGVVGSLLSALIVDGGAFIKTASRLIILGLYLYFIIRYFKHRFVWMSVVAIVFSLFVGWKMLMFAKPSAEHRVLQTLERVMQSPLPPPERRRPHRP
ncbi:hypothetical protein [Pleionea sp. CnH1-48]|uniref:hypothetical protein n=1 Tax=Pleionea sp. CnH1-48 TaxID=2954494 RepID=UPI002097752D|nr:hypothetical protein [Pleionea sp. CnH1-48]MCO7223540.1 hypothetical protein [Pleionea sp. CnH1-48]